MLYNYIYSFSVRLAHYYFLFFRKDYFNINKVLSSDLCPGNIFQMAGQTCSLKMSNKIVQGEMASIDYFAQ